MCQISSFMAAAEGPVAEFSSFANFAEKKRKSNLLMSFPKTGNQMGSFGQIRKKMFFSLLSADSRYFRTYALKNNAEAEILKRIDIILCVETSENTIQFNVFLNLTV